jgi:serine/threonine protein kinase
MLNVNRSPKRERHRTRIKRLGAGAFGVVDLMSDRTVDKRIRFNTQEQRDIILREVELLQALTPHPNIVGYIGHRFHPTEAFITMEHAPGAPVAQWVAEHADNDVVRRTTWFPFAQTLLHAVNYMHRRGVHHLDLHDKNVMVSPMHRSLRIIDFGLSCGRGCPIEPCPPNPDWSAHRNACGDASIVTHLTQHSMGGSSAPQLRSIDLYFVGGLAHLWWFGYKPYMHDRPVPMEPFQWVYFAGAVMPDPYPPTLNEPGLSANADEEAAHAAMRHLLCNVRLKQCSRGATLELEPVLTGLVSPRELWRS